MDYELTEHARDSLEKRKILQEWMEKVLASPEVTEPDPVDIELEHRLARVPAYDNRVLRIIVNIKSTPPRIVTAFFDRRRLIQ
jgi:hypothetical protein